MLRDSDVLTFTQFRCPSTSVSAFVESNTCSNASIFVTPSLKFEESACIFSQSETLFECQAEWKDHHLKRALAQTHEQIPTRVEESRFPVEELAFGSTSRRRGIDTNFVHGLKTDISYLRQASSKIKHRKKASHIPQARHQLVKPQLLITTICAIWNSINSSKWLSNHAVPQGRCTPVCQRAVSRSFTDSTAILLMHLLDLPRVSS